MIDFDLLLMMMMIYLVIIFMIRRVLGGNCRCVLVIIVKDLAKIDSTLEKYGLLLMIIRIVCVCAFNNKWRQKI